MNCFQSVLWGGLGGVLGAFVGQAGVTLAYRWTGDANIWLKGPHGPPFFDLTLSTSLFYGVLAMCLCQGSWKARGREARIVFAAAFSGLALPMMLATHIFTWGEAPKAPPTWAWVYLVLASNAAATIAATAALGFLVSRSRSWLRALGAILGALAAWLLQLAARTFFPHWGEGVEIIGFLPPPSALTSGALWGVMVGLGIVVMEIRRSYGQTSING